MAGYIGKGVAGVASVSERKKVFTATSGQTAFTPSGGYTIYNVDVFQNGVRLVDGTDYTATDGTTVTLTNGAQVDDEIVIIAKGSYSNTDSFTKSELANHDDITVTSEGKVGVNTSSPSAMLHVEGNAIAKTNTDTTNTGTVTLDFGANQNFVLTLTGNVTLANPSTETVGQSGFIVFIQDSTGGRTVSLGTDYETAGGAGLTLSSTASATDVVPYIVAASGRILLGKPQLAFS